MSGDNLDPSLEEELLSVTAQPKKSVSGFIDIIVISLFAEAQKTRRCRRGNRLSFLDKI
jgi:hypothetical protein